MLESVLLRVRRLLTAEVDDAVGRLERSGSDRAMREALREIDRVIGEVRGDHETATARRLQAQRHHEALQAIIGKLTDNAGLAAGNGRADLAVVALSRRAGFEEQARRLAAAWTLAGEDEARRKEELDMLEARKRDMDRAITAFRAARRPAAALLPMLCPFRA